VPTANGAQYSTGYSALLTIGYLPFDISEAEKQKRPAGIFQQGRFQLVKPNCFAKLRLCHYDPRNLTSRRGPFGVAGFHANRALEGGGIGPTSFDGLT
jgi:hypothetical protein